MWWTSSSGRIELQMTKQQANSASHQGRCDNDVRALSEIPAIKRQLAKIDKQQLINELREYGVWEDDELQDHDQNLQRLLWVSAGDIVGEGKYHMHMQIKFRFSHTTAFEGEYDSLKDAVVDAVSKNANLTGINLTGANLTGINLTGINLTGANLTGANLYGANLTGINLTGANLTGANLYGANLTGADLRGADLRGADLRGADLRGADLRGINLYGANLYGINLLTYTALT